MNPNDPWAARYDKRKAQRPPNPHLAATLSRIDAPPGRALDLACGAGRHFDLLIEHGFAPIGVDLSTAALGRCDRSAQAVPLIQGDACTLPFVDNAFDLIVAWGLLFHLTSGQLHNTLREIRRTLARPGAAILHALDPSDWRRDPSKSDQREQKSRLLEGVFDSFHTREQLTALLKPYFEIVSQELVSSQHDYGRSAEWIVVAMRYGRVGVAG
jgi:SAM-dependent methyltransferase